MRVFKIQLFSLAFLMTLSFNSFAGPIGSVDEAHSEKPKVKCEILLVSAVKKSANPELNYQLQSQLRSEVFVKSIQESVDKVSPLKTQSINFSQYFENSVALSQLLMRILNSSIVGFERQGFQSASYVEKGLAEEDGVIYRIQHEDGKFSFIILSRGGDTLEGFDIDVFAAGDLKLGALPGQTEDLSAISIEVFTEEENGVLQGNRFTALPSPDFVLKHHKYVSMEKSQWHDWFLDRLAGAKDHGVQALEPHIWGIQFMKDMSEEL